MRPHPVSSRSVRLLVAGVVVVVAVLVTVPAGAAPPGPYAAPVVVNPGLDPAFRYPMTVPVSGTVESLVGGGCPSARAHSGVDISSPDGTAAEVQAAYPGFARSVDTDDGYGLVVEIVHFGEGVRYLSRYAHLSRALVPPEGRWVTQGEVIAMTGATGNAQIVHLHFEVRTADDAVVDLNPGFRPCRREVTAGAPIPVELPGLVPPAAVAIASLAANNWAVTGVGPEASEAATAGATADGAAECRYWDRAVDRNASECGAGAGARGDGRRPGPRRGD